MSTSVEKEKQNNELRAQKRISVKYERFLQTLKTIDNFRDIASYISTNQKIIFDYSNISLTMAARKEKRREFYHASPISYLDFNQSNKTNYYSGVPKLLSQNGRDKGWGGTFSIYMETLRNNEFFTTLNNFLSLANIVPTTNMLQDRQKYWLKRFHENITVEAFMKYEDFPYLAWEHLKNYKKNQPYVSSSAFVNISHVMADHPELQKEMLTDTFRDIFSFYKHELSADTITRMQEIQIRIDKMILHKHVQVVDAPSGKSKKRL